MTKPSTLSLRKAACDTQHIKEHHTEEVAALKRRLAELENPRTKPSEILSCGSRRNVAGKAGFF